MSGPGAPTGGSPAARAMRVLVAPDCYGDSLTAAQAAAAIAAGWNRTRPGDHFTIVPQSDGGPGFVTVLAERVGELRRLRVSGPLDGKMDDKVDARWVHDRPSATAYLGSSEACGLALLDGPPTPRSALGAHSRGVGQLLAAALDAGVARIVVGLGGSASTDGGRGLVDELGGLRTARRRLAEVELVAACDVEHPLLGPWGAARVFGPQKGADPDTVTALEQRLSRWAAELDAAAGRAVSAESGAGAAGGIGAGLLALGGRCESGAAIVAEHTRLADHIAVADLVVTGEGRLDQQSLQGKVVGALAAAARARQVPVLVLAGQVCLDDSAQRSAGILAACAVADYAGSVRLALVDAANQLMGLASAAAVHLGNSDVTRYL